MGHSPKKINVLSMLWEKEGFVEFQFSTNITELPHFTCVETREA